MTALALRPARLRSTPGRSITRLQRGLMWLVGASGGIVAIEPAPYEFVVALAMLVFVATGLQLRPAHLPLLLLLIAYNIGYLIGVVPVLTEEGTVIWTAVSCFMSVTTLFFALVPTVLALQRTMTGRLRDFLIGGLMTAVLAIELLSAFSRGAWGSFGAAARRRAEAFAGVPDARRHPT